MKRWVVKYTNANTQTTKWVTLNGGTSEKEDSAFMYTKKGVAENRVKDIKKYHYGCIDVEMVEYELYPVDGKTSRVSRQMTPKMREIMLRCEEFTVDEMWTMLLALAESNVNEK
jgi:hypothetical protein